MVQHTHSHPAILKLTEQDFTGDKLNKNECCAVLFFAPWCGHCQMFWPTWVQTAKMIGFMDLYSVNSDENEKLIETFKDKIPGFPTIMVFKNGKVSDIYDGPRDLNSMVEYLKICHT